MELKEYNQCQIRLMNNVGIDKYFVKTSFHSESLAEIIGKYRSLSISSFVLRTALLIKYFKSHDMV